MSIHKMLATQKKLSLIFAFIIILGVLSLGCSKLSYKKQEIDLLHYEAIDKIEYEDNLILKRKHLNLIKGWLFSKNGAWVVEEYTQVPFQIIHPRTLYLTISGYSMTCIKNEQDISLFINDYPIKIITFISDYSRRYIIPIKSELLKYGSNSLSLKASMGCTLSSIGKDSIRKSNTAAVLYFFLNDLRIGDERRHDDIWKNAAFSFYLPYGTSHLMELKLGINCTSPYAHGEITRYIIEKNNNGEKMVLGNYSLTCNTTKKKTLNIRVPLKNKTNKIPLLTLKIVGEGYGFSSPSIERLTVRYKDAITKKAKPNVLLFLFDSLRYDHVSDNNYSRKTTPALDQVAKKAIAFNRAYVQVPGTIGSVSSILTSRYPFWQNDAILDNRFARLPEALLKKGYHTALLSQNQWISSKYNIQKGFQEEKALNDNNFAKEVMKTIINGINSKGTFFAYVHSMQPHYPYLPPPSFYIQYAKNSEFISFPDPKEVAVDLHVELSPSQVADLIDQYDSNILYGDYKLSQIISALKVLNLFDDNLLMIISADHGEEFMDHNGSLHGATLYEELIHVPFYIYYPPLIKHPKKVECPIESLDITPTILELAGFNSNEIASYGFQGKSLVPMMKQEKKCTKNHAYSLIETLSVYGIVSERFKLIQCKAGIIGLYSGRHKCLKCFIDLNKKEECSLPKSDAELKIMETLDLQLENWLAVEQARYSGMGTPNKPELSKEEIERFRTLGYLK